MDVEEDGIKGIANLGVKKMLRNETSRDIKNYTNLITCFGFDQKYKAILEKGFLHVEGFRPEQKYE